MESNYNVCLVSCTLPMDDKMVMVWNQLNEELQKNKYKLFLLTTSVHKDLKCEHLNIPFSLDEFDELNIAISVGIDTEEKVTALDLTQRELEWFKKDAQKWNNHFTGYFKCKSFYRSIINSLKPSVIVAWQNSLPQSNILKRLGEEYSIPSFILERGMLPDTFMMESRGNVALSDIINSHAVRNSILNNTDYSSYEKIQKYYIKNKPAKYNQKNYEDSLAELNSFFPKAKHLIVYFANVDSSVGVYPEDTALSLKTSINYRNSQETIKALSEAAVQIGFNLLIKLHPQDRSDYSAFQNNNTRIVRDFNYQLLMEKGDTLAFSCTTLQFEALLYEKPIVLLSNTELSGFNIVYEMKNEQNLDSILRKAIGKENHEEKKQNGKRFIHWAASFFLFAYSDDIPVKNKLADMAYHLATTGSFNLIINTESAIERLHNYLTQIRYGRYYSKADISIKNTSQSNDLSENLESENQIALLKNLFRELEYISDDAEVLAKIGRVYYNLGDFRNSAEYLNKADRITRISNVERNEIEANTDDNHEEIEHIASTLTSAQEQIEYKNYFHAYLLIQKLEAEDSKNESVQKVFDLLNNSIDSLKKEKKWNSKKSVDLLVSAEELIEKQKLEKAKENLFALLNLEPEHIEALNDLSVVSILESNFDFASDVIDLVLKLDQFNETALGNRSYLQTQIHEKSAPELVVLKIDSREDFINHSDSMKDQFVERAEYENSLVKDEKPFTVNGFCYVCGTEQKFQVDYFAASIVNGKKIPNWRERLVCPKCNLSNRNRASIHLLCDYILSDSESKIYIAEQTTPLYAYLKTRYSNLIGSEYIGDSLAYGAVNEMGIRNEDFTKLTFADNYFDNVFSFDVFEHIPDYIKAFSESLRVLKPGGKLLFSVPFNRDNEKNLVRAIIKNGQVEHIYPPEFHGDPLNASEGCLCFYHFGWEVLEELKSVGFASAYALTFYSRELAYLGGEQLFIVAEKSGADLLPA